MFLTSFFLIKYWYYNKDVIILSNRPGLISLMINRTRDQNKEKDHGYVSIPRRNKADSFFVSLCRFGFYYIDYLIGQLYVKLKYTWRDKIVIYDSYYFDFLNDTAEAKMAVLKECGISVCKSVDEIGKTMKDLLK